MDGSGQGGNTGPVLTVGHSSHTREIFLELLTRHHVTALADVRSAPYSRFNPHFDRERLSGTLEASGIRYVYLGDRLGGRSDDRSCYEHGRVRYDRLARTPLFLDGLRRIVRGAEKYRVALMCAEREPLHCHRTLLIGHELDRRGVGVAHILPDGRIEPHASAMTRLLAELNLENETDLFHGHRPRGELVAEAIAAQARRVGHVIEPAADASERNRR